MKLNLSDFNAMSPSQKENVIKQLATGPAADVKEIEYTIMKYESIYDMSSQEMLNGLNNGILREDKEITHWLFLLDTVKLLNGN